MKHLNLMGWNVSVERITILEPDPDKAPGETKPSDGWALVFTEVVPRTGDTVRFEMGREAKDFVVRELTGGIVLHGGELPQR